MQTQIEVLTKENFKTKNELKEAVFQMNLWKTEIGKIGKVADFGGKTGLESKFMDLEKVINEQKASLNEALASLQGFANGQKKFEGQISEDFAILTSWAKSLERKISLQPVEITCHIEKFIKGFEEDLHKYRKDINGQINEIYKEFSLEVTKLKQDTIQIYSHLKNAKENYG